MREISCKRCGQEKSIPTHQHVKFDLEVHDLCDACWESFRHWFHAGPRHSSKLPKAA